MVEERVSEIEGRIIEIIYFEKKRENRLDNFLW